MLLAFLLLLPLSDPPSATEGVPTLLSQILEQEASLQKEGAQREGVDSEGPALPASTVPS